MTGVLVGGNSRTLLASTTSLILSSAEGAHTSQSGTTPLVELFVFFLSHDFADLLTDQVCFSVLYWIDVGGQDVPHKIASVNLDGSEPKVLWKQNLLHVDEIAIDIENRRLFWTNAGMRSVSWIALQLQCPELNVQSIGS